jgi:hypothetical protein
MRSVELDDELLATLQAEAERTGVPLLEILRRLLREELDDGEFGSSEMT